MKRFYTGGRCNKFILPVWEQLHFQGRQLFQNVLVPSKKKGVHTKRKEFAFFGNKFIAFRVGTIQKGFGIQESKQEVIKFVSLAINGWKSTKCIH